MSSPRSDSARELGDTEGLGVVGQHPWRVRLRGPDGAVVGAGVLVDRWHVLTCAHVVSAVLGVGRSGAPVGKVSAELPFAPVAGDGGRAQDPVQLGARVAAQGWAPASVQGGGDLTLLRLEQAAPPDCAVARLARAEDTSGWGVLVYGHPDGLDEGVWVRTRVSGVGGPGGEWLQLDAAQFAGRSVTRGFSGAGAVDEKSGQVLGIVVAQDGEAGTRVAWAIRTEAAATYLPFLAALLRGKADDANAPGAAAQNRRESQKESDAPGPVHRLGNDEWDHLFALLRAVPGMVEWQSWDLYVRLLEQRFGIQLALPRHRASRLDIADRLDVLELMQALEDRPDSVRRLVTILQSIHPQSQQVAALEEFVERTFPDLLLEHTERVRLEEMLDGVAPVWIATALSSATAQLAIPPSTGHRSVAQAIHDLEGYGRLRGGSPPPLLVFVDDLAHEIDGQVGVALHRWIDEVAARLRVPRTQITTLCAAAARRREERQALSLLVLLEPDGATADRYLMSALLMLQDRTERVLHRDDVSRTLPEIAHELDDALRSVPETLGDQAHDPVIEFVLPRRLLGEVVEEWEFGKAGFPARLGMRYHVVVRSLDRMRDPTHYPIWRRKWRRLVETGHRVDAGALHVLRPQRPDALSAQALFARLTGQETVVCLAIPHPPDTSLPIETDAFAAGLAAGIPVILWARESVDPDTFGEVVRNSLASVPRRIPHRVLQHRQKLASEPERPGRLVHGVGLIFDDADRIPQQVRHPIRLQAPR